MLRNSLVLIILSAIVVFLLHKFGLIAKAILYLDYRLTHATSIIFNSRHLAIVSAQMMLLVLIPAVVGTIVGGTYYMVQKRPMPALKPVIWTSWLIVATILAMTAVI